MAPVWPIQRIFPEERSDAADPNNLNRSRITIRLPHG